MLPEILADIKAGKMVIITDAEDRENEGDLLMAAQFVTPEARVGNAAQVRVKDAYGQQHYVMVEPDSDDVLKQGDAVLLVSLDGNTFKAILNPSGSLVD